MAPSQFIFVVCQHGAEHACKQEITDNHPDLRLAYSRPGFITFKQAEAGLPKSFSLRSTLARTYGFSTGRVSGNSLLELATAIENHPCWSEARQIHLWQRDLTLPGDRGYEPGPTELVRAIAQELNQRWAARPASTPEPPPAINGRTRPGERVLDVALVEPHEWWLGYHDAATTAQRWPGGVPPFDLSRDVISRAYWKLEEALLWSGIFVQPDDLCIELGSAPGGSCQRLLEKGARVIAIDPAELDPAIAEHPQLTHFKGRGREIKKARLKGARWLLADMNVAPGYTLDTVQEICTNRHLNTLRGMILTLKLPDWTLVSQIPEMMQRVQEMGFGVVKCRQLAFNRQEFCLVAARDRYSLRSSRLRKSKAKPPSESA